MRRTAVLAILVATSAGLAGCGIGFVVRHAMRESDKTSTASSQADEHQVIASLQRYQQLALTGDTDRVADMFVPSGELSKQGDEPLTGREQIRKYLKSQADTSIRDYKLLATSTHVDGTLGLQSGTFDQSFSAPNGLVQKVTGTFDASWERQSDGRWLLARMHTTVRATP
jgi:uncharacterized protein (TIGR02246 family)